jgi:hypothetical protein
MLRSTDQHHTHIHRATLRPPLVLKSAQESYLSQVADSLPLQYRGRFHRYVRARLMGAPTDGVVHDAARRVRRAILSGARLAAKR